MSIKKDCFLYPLDKGEESEGVMFDTLNDSRLVNPIHTATIILSIKKWVDSNLGYEFDTNHLIPENIVQEDDTQENCIQKYSEFYVDSCYKLLKPKKNLSFDEALFILFGLDPYRLALPPFFNFRAEEYKPFADGASLESVFYVTKQHQALFRSSYLINGKISSEDLIELAKDNDFFQEKGLRQILKQKKKTVNTETDLRNAKIIDKWNELSPKLNGRYPSKVSIYRKIKFLLNLDITEDMIKKIIANSTK